jgi:tetratricopeptide (TPR) repeat protein
MKAILFVLLLAGAVACPAQQSAQSPLGVDDIRDAILAANAHHGQEAIRLFTDAIQLRTERVKDPALSATEKSNIYYFRGRAHQYRARLYQYRDNSAERTQGDFDRENEDDNSAIADFGAAIAADPSNAEAYRSRGETDWDNNEKAIADFTAALKLNTLDPKETAETYIARGREYGFDQSAEAIADYGAVLSIDPKYADAYYERGERYDEQGHRDLAIADYSSVLPLVADAPDASFGAGDAYYRRGKDQDQLGRHDLAIADFTAAISAPESGWHDPTDSLGDAYGARAKAEERKGQYEQAIADCTKIIDLNLGEPDETAETYSERGDNYAHLGQDKKANLDRAHALEIKYDLLCNQEGWEACSVDGK